MNIEAARQIADAVLYEGYVLYPYRASAAKNRFRWQIGLVVPREYAESAQSDPYFTQTECLAEPGSRARLSLVLRCLQVQERTIEAPAGSGQGWRAVHELHVGTRHLITWEEAVVRELAVGPLALDGRPLARTIAWRLDGGSETEAVHDEAGQIGARIIRQRQPVDMAVHVAVEPCDRLVRIRVRTENVTACRARTLAERRDALRQSVAGAHAVLGLEDGAFLSLLDPPPSAAALAATCTNVHTWPALVGSPGSRDVVLSSPVILDDYPAVAPESAGDLYDATEIDELLMLRVQTLTEEEKREARATDPRAAAIIDRASGVSAEAMGRLHGAIRHIGTAPPRAGLEAWEEFLNPPGAGPEAAAVEVGGILIGRGSRVRLRPARRSDSLDICLRDRRATVTGVHTTLENTTYVAVTLDDDPAGPGDSRYRRALFFHPDELLPVDPDTAERRP